MTAKQNRSALIVEDESSLRLVYVERFSQMGFETDSASDGVEAINLINERTFDIVLLDIGLPRVDGLEVLEHIREHSPSSEVIILTGVSDVRIAVKAMKLGAQDYLMKPIRADELAIVVNRTLEKKSLISSKKLLEQSVKRLGGDDDVVGESEGWKNVLERARKFAESDSTVYIEGETGSGKEVLARFLHMNSPRSEEAFVVVDCGVIPESLIESELFGHTKGAFTGAISTTDGLVELAKNGTLFLDEIGDIDLAFQQKLLKFLESQEYRRVGDPKVRKIDVRIIAATNKNIEEMINEGTFRSDLWYRLNTLKIELPPLRARRDDVIPLAEYFIKRFSRTRQKKNLTDEAKSALLQYAWPGNVRELRSAIQRALTVSDDELITVEDLGLETSILSQSSLTEEQFSSLGLSSLRTMEQHFIEYVLISVDWNISRAAKILQIGRNTLYSKIKEYDIQQPQV